METGWILYALFAVLTFVFWRRVRGKSMERLFEDSHHDHERVLSVLAKYPEGADWRQHRKRMRAAGSKKPKSRQGS